MNSTTKYLFALIGHPLSHSLSPSLHAAALRFAGLQGDYRLIDIEPASLTEDLAQAIEMGLNGFNVTIPYKQNIYALVNSLTNEAQLTGAVNTVKVENDGQLSGHNTDLIGFKLAFSEALTINIKNKEALVIGAGGAAKAAIIALSQMGVAKIHILNRDSNKLNLFIAQMDKKIATLNSHTYLVVYSPNCLSNIAVVVNASPIGLPNLSMPNWCEELLDALNKDCSIFDMVYNKNGSAPAFAQLAKDKGLKTIDGIPMLIHQARFAFQYWTGIQVPSQVMRDALSF